MSLKRSLPLVLILFFVGIVVFLRQPDNGGHRARSALIMGTVVDVRVYGEDEKRLEKALDEAFAEMSRVEQIFSNHIASSEISQLSAATEPLVLSLETVALLKRGQQIALQSSGAFDMTLGAVKKLWNIENNRSRIPTAEELADALEGTGSGALEIDGTEVRKARAGIMVDLGGIAKGYAVDQAVRKLREYGVRSATVNAGGDIRLLGDKNGQPWRIGIQHPRQQDALLLTLKVKDQAVVSSGDYERFFEFNGVRYHHIFDPASGRPARQCQSVTVVADDAASADALATAAFVLGPVDGLKLLEDLPGVEGLVVAIDGSVLKTSGLPE